MRIEDLIVDENASVLDALKQLDATGCKVLFAAPGGKLKAVVTDGDVRRHLLAGGGLDAPVRAMANYRPISLPLARAGEARRVIARHGINALPLLDEEGRIADVEFASGLDVDVTTKVDIPVVMMAGGLGTRLYPYTKILPKPLIPVGDVPIAEHIMNRFYASGCHHFSLVVNYKKGMIKSYFNELEKPYEVEYADEDTPLGTGGGLRLLRDKLPGTFFLTNCDILVDADFGKLYEFHRDNRNVITMVCSLKDYTIPYGVVEQQGGVLTGMREKPHMSFYINTGLYVVEPSVIELIEPGRLTPFTELIERVREGGGRVGVYPVSEQSWMDMGQLEELENMRRRLEQQH